MNATTTATRVLSWASNAPASARPALEIRPTSPEGRVPAPRRHSEPPSRPEPPPSGPLRHTTKLTDLSDQTRSAVAAFARDAAARLGAGSPAFGDGTPVGLGPLLLAAAIGGRHEVGAATALAEAVPRLRLAEGGWPDAVARHGVVAPTVAPAAGSPVDRCIVDPGLFDAMLDASPLTAVLHRPPASRVDEDATGREVETATALLRRPRGRAVLTTSLAHWSPDPHVLRWRTGLLTRLCTAHVDVVLDTYLAARLRHGAAWDRLTTWAGGELRATRGAADPLAVETARFWAPLLTLGRRNLELLRERPLLDGYGPALSLVTTYRLSAVRGG